MQPSTPRNIVRPVGAPSVQGGAIIGLDLVRFAAALLVVLYHYAFFAWHEPVGDTGLRAAIGTPAAFPRLVPVSWWGWVGVQIFFVISGLVICRSAERQSPAAFLRSRVLRLVPALWVFATLSLFVTLLFSSAQPETLLAMYARSLVLFPKGPWIDGVYWTLTIEAVFYAVTLLLIAKGWFSHLRRIAVTASLGIFGFYLLVLAARLWPEARFADSVLTLADAYGSRLLLLTTGAYFLVGIHLHLADRDGWNPVVAVGLCASLVAGAVGIWISAETLPGVVAFGHSPAVPVAIWLVVVALLALSLRCHRVSGGSVRVRSAARSIGLASYPLYLFHNIAGAFLFGILLRAEMGSAAALTVAIALAVLVSFGFALWAEPPCRRALARSVDRLADLVPGAFFRSNLKGRDRT